MLLELNAGQLMLIMKTGPLPDALPGLPDALELGFHCVGTRWIRGFMAFHLTGTHGP